MDAVWVYPSSVSNSGVMSSADTTESDLVVAAMFVIAPR